MCALSTFVDVIANDTITRVTDVTGARKGTVYV